MQDDPQDQATRFLSALYGKAQEGYAVLWTKQDKLSRFRLASDPGGIAQEAVKLAQAMDCYFGVGLQPAILDAHHRGKEADVCALPGLWVDIDVKGPNHKSDNLPATLDDALGLLSVIPVQPTIIVRTGGGIHAWWLFRDVFRIGNPEERSFIRSLCDRLQHAIQSSAAEKGWKVDSTSDLARVLRLPGTMNHKSEPVAQATIVKENLDARYAPHELDAILPHAQKDAEKPTNAKKKDAEQAPAACDLEGQYEQEFYLGVSREERRGRYAAYLSKVPGAVSGNGGHPALLKAVAHRHGFGVPKADARTALLMAFNPRCQPPWSEPEIDHKIGDAKPLPTHPPGCRLTKEVAPPPPARKAPPAFPVETLPAELRRVAEDISLAAQVPVDLPAQYGLAVISLLAARAGVVVEWKPGMTEPPNLYVVTVLPPSERKSTSLSPIVRPLLNIQREEQEAAAESIAKATAEQKLMAKRIDKCMDDIAKGKASQQTLDELIQRARRVKIPARTSYLLDDVTPETLCTTLKGNKAVGILSAEANIIENMSGRYSRTGEGQITPYLKFWKGEPYVVTRQNREEDLEGCLLSLGIACQPMALKRLVRSVKGSRDLGLLSRFLFSVPASLVGTRSADDRGFDPSVHGEWDALVHRVARLGKKELTLTPDALAELRAWRLEIEPRLKADLEPVADWAGKVQVGQVVRLAACLHACESDALEIGVDVMRRSITLARFYVEHALVAFEVMESSDFEEWAEKIARWAEHAREKGFTQTDCQRKFHQPKAVLKPILEYMVDTGWLKAVGKRLYLQAGWPARPPVTVNDSGISIITTSRATETKTASIPGIIVVDSGTQPADIDPLGGGPEDDFRDCIGDGIEEELSRARMLGV